MGLTWSSPWSKSFRDELTQVSMAQKDVLNIGDQMNAAEKAIEDIIQIRAGVCADVSKGVSQ
jgi:hypothetical protein